MRFSIQDQNEKKMFFHVSAAAQKATGLNLTTIKAILERGNPIYHRMSDNKLFEIRKEDPIRIVTIEGEDFFSLEEIHKKFDLSPTKFLNQVKNGKFAKKIDWISPELSSPENADEDEKIDELEKFRAEMQFQFEKLQAEMQFQFEKFQAEMNSQLEKLQEENNQLSSRVETLEKEKAELEKEKSVLPPKAPVPEEKDSPKDSLKQYPIREKPIFQAKTLLQRSTFFTAKSMAVFIRSGIVGRLISCTPKNQKFVLLDEKREYLPDLVEEIVVTHILAEMGTGTEADENEKVKEFRERVDIRKFDCTGLAKKDQKDISNSAVMIGRIRRLDWETMQNIVKEVMKII